MYLFFVIATANELLRLRTFVQDFVVSKMGTTYIEPPTFDLNSSYEDSDFSTPLIFILSPGADPMASLVKFAEEKGAYHCKPARTV